LSTNALQALLVQLTASDIESGTLGVGPFIKSVWFNKASSNLEVSVVPAAGSSAVVAATFMASMVTLEKLDTTAGWQVATSAGPATLAGNKILVPVSSADLTINSPATIFRLTITAPINTPIVDTQGRPLTPNPFARTLQCVADSSGSAVLAPTF
jgi:hypothetical protein